MAWKVKQTLCWDCVNAVPDKDGERGCSWSREFIPVDGWDAKETKIVSNYRKRGELLIYGDSYEVYECPEFVRG